MVQNDRKTLRYSCMKRMLEEKFKENLFNEE